MEKKKTLSIIILIVASIWNSGVDVMASANIQYIWDYVASACGNELGASALLGNLQAESGIIPYRKQGDFTSGYVKSIEYTEKVDNGTITREQFTTDNIGYGLAQWTFSTRKANYYDWCQNRGTSIGDTDSAVSFLVDELQNSYPSVWSALVNATDIETASNKVLHDFENPREQGRNVEIYRASLGASIQAEYGHTVPPTPPIPPAPPPTPTTDYSRILLSIIGDDENG